LLRVLRRLRDEAELEESSKSSRKAVEVVGDRQS
jgi:hypothetical protein